MTEFDDLYRLSLSDQQKLPPSTEGWKREVNREKELIVRVRCVRLPDCGETRRYYITTPKPATKTEMRSMKRRLREICTAKNALIVEREKALIRQPRTKRQRGKKRDTR
jgi:hypothetical protein